MKDNRYANIIVCYGDADRDILTKQIKMYRDISVVTISATRIFFMLMPVIR